MRISRGRLFLRVALLLVGGAFMEWRAWEAWEAARAQAGAGQVLAQRLAVVMGLVGVLALLTAAAAGWPLRRKARRPVLGLSGKSPRPPPSGGP